MNTKITREKRYKQKLELIEERIDDVEALIRDFSDKIKRLACYKAFQELAEATFDIAAMTIKDKGKLVEDDYNNLEKLKNLGLIEESDIFESLPLYIKIEIINNNKIIFTNDISELSYYFYFFRKLWNDQSVNWIER